MFTLGEQQQSNKGVKGVTAVLPQLLEAHGIIELYEII
jgi:hypothetical protein